MATNTATNVGVRVECGSLGMRNYEPAGSGQQYESARENLEYGGTQYDVGDEIPFDGSSCYTDDALMERYFNAGWLTPIEA